MERQKINRAIEEITRQAAQKKPNVIPIQAIKQRAHELYPHLDILRKHHG